jgi:hypothetical protein
VIKVTVRDDDREDYPILLVRKVKPGFIAGICLAVFFAFANLVVCPLMVVVHGPSDWQAVPVFGIFGAVLAEGGLLSTLLVLSTGSFWLRAACCWMVGLILWACWALGLLWAERFRSWGAFGEVFQLGSLSLPLAALAIQSPLWLFRGFSGWRLASGNSGATPIPPLSIGDFFVGTVITAVSLAFARLARPAGWSPDDYWVGWAIVFASFAGGSLLGVLPAMLFMFRVRKSWLVFLLLMVYALVVSIAIVCIFNFADPGSRPQAFETIGLATMFLSLAAFLGAGFKIARDCGYSLIIGRAGER